MAVSAEAEAVLAAKFAVIRGLGLDERQWRGYLGSEARALGYGGIAAVARAAGVAPSTVAAGVAEIEGEPALPPGRTRRAGGGRKKLEEKEPGLAQALRAVLEAGTREEPAAELAWCSLSLRQIGQRLAGLGFECGKDSIARMMREQGYSLQGMSRVEGRQLADRDAQFRHINAMIASFRSAGDPVVSVDAEETGRIVPYGVYDIAADRGFVSVGVSRDTAAFAVNALRSWWRAEGSARYAGARRLLVTCGAGGPAGRWWMHDLALLAQESHLRITVLHSPPGTSKWNKAEHRLFCHITGTWRARPSMTAEEAVTAIAAAATSQGLECTAVLDPDEYPREHVSDERMSYLEDRVLDRHEMHGEWNYTVLPAPRHAVRPAPAVAASTRDVLNHPALTGMSPADLSALAVALEDPFAERREQLSHTRRGGSRVRAVKDPHVIHGNRRLDVLGHVLALRLRDHLRLPVAIVGALLGVDPTTVSHATTLTRELLAGKGVPLPSAVSPHAPRLRTLEDLREYAAAAGITLIVPEIGPRLPKYAKRGRAGTEETDPGETGASH